MPRSQILTVMGLICLSLAALAAPIQAAAHAVVIESTPAGGAVLGPGDIAIVLHYNSRIDHARSRLTLIASDGRTSPIAIETDSPADIVAAKAPIAAPGEYRLRWQVLAVDGHLTRGDIPFSVKAP